MSAWKQYMEQDVQTSHPIKNVISIYEACHRKIRIAEESAGKLKFRDARDELDKVDLLLYELKMQLNKDLPDKELYENLFDLYDYMQREVEIMKNVYDFKNKQVVLDILNDLIEAYKGVLNNV